MQNFHAANLPDERVIINPCSSRPQFADNKTQAGGSGRGVGLVDFGIENKA
jgi:hypothetical protein